MAHSALQKSALQPPPSLRLTDKTAPQTTLKQAIHCRGTGLHSGLPIQMTLCPADANTGICFQRCDLPGEPVFRVQPDSVVNTYLSTVIAPPNYPDAIIGTIEHLMAALHALEIDNICVQVTGPELPVLDGCSEAFVFLLRCAGQHTLDAPRLQVEILHPVRVEGPDGAWAALIPQEDATLHLDVAIDFAAPIIGRQRYVMTLNPTSFQQEIASARTFVECTVLETLSMQGLAQGGSLENALVVDGDHVLNPAGLRYPDEFVRHKTLDVIGDLYCTGYQLIGRFQGVRCGHELNNRLLRALFARSEQWRFTPARQRPSRSIQKIAA